MAKRDLIVVISGDNKGLKAALRSATRDLREFGDKLGSIGKTLSLTVTPAILGLGAASLKIAGEFEQSQIAFETLLGSAKAAAEFLEKLADFAKRTPFDLAGVQDAAKRLIAMGIAAKDVIPTLSAVGDATAAIGGGKDVLNGIVTALGQMTAKAKVSAEEMRQLAERGIPAWQILAEKIGVDVPKAMKLAEQGALNGITAVKALAEGLSEEFGGLMEKQAATLLGQIERIKDEAVLLLRDIGQAIMPTVEPVLGFVAMALEKVRDLAAAFKDADPAIQRMVVAFAGFLAALGPIVLALAGVAKVIAIVATASTGVIAAISGVGVVLAAAGAAFVLFFDQIKAAASALMERWEIVWTGMLLVLEIAKAALVAFGGAAFFDEFIRQLGVLKAIVGAVFGFVADLVKRALVVVVDSVIRLADVLAKLPGSVGKAAKDFQVAVRNFQADQFKKISDEAKAVAGATEEVGDAASKAAPKVGNWADQVIRGGDAAAKAAKVLPDIALMFQILSNNANFVLAQAIKKAKEETAALRDVAGEIPPKIDQAAAGMKGLATSAEEAEDALEKIPSPLERAKEAAKSLNFVVKAELVQSLQEAKAAVQAIELAEKQGLASSRDVIQARIALLDQWKNAAILGAAEWSDDLQQRLETNQAKMEEFTTSSGNAWATLGTQISTILTDLGKSIADSILGAQSLSDAFVNAAKAIAEAILRTIIEGALSLMIESIKENEVAVGGLISAFKKFIGLFTGSAKSLGGKGGGGGAGGGLGEFGGVLAALDSLVNIITSLINLFTIRRIEKDVARIEVTTRGMLNELLNRRDDAWSQHDGLLAKFDLAIPALWDIKEAIKETNMILAAALGGVVTSGSQDPLIVEAGPILAAEIFAIKEAIQTVVFGVVMLGQQQANVILPQLKMQNSLLVAILLTLNAIKAGSGGGDETIPFGIPESVTGGGRAPLVGQVNVSNLDPVEIGQKIVEAVKARGGQRGTQALELKF